MRAVIQRVTRASVHIDERLYSEIGQGLLAFVGIENDDTEEDAHWTAHKIINLRIFGDSFGKMNLNCRDVAGEILCVSQFTLCASMQKGARPSFENAMEPSKAIVLFDYLVVKMQQSIMVKVGKFGSHMLVNIENDGPVTLVLASKQR